MNPRTATVGAGGHRVRLVYPARLRHHDHVPFPRADLRSSPGRGATLLALLLGGCLWSNPEFQGATATAAATTTDATTGTAAAGTYAPTTTRTGTGSGGTLEMSAGGTTDVTTGGSSSETSASASTASTGSIGAESCPAHANLVACYNIPANETAVLVDGSGGHHGSMTAINLADSVLPDFGEALAVDPTSIVKVDEHPDFDPPELTFSLLLRPDTEGQILDNDGQYGLRIAQATVQCTMVTDTDQSATASRPIDMGEWSLVGCSFDGSNVHLWVFHAGNHSSDQTNLSGTLNPDASAGLVLGNESPNPSYPLTGLIDRVLLFNARLDPSEICTFYAPYC